MLVCVFNLGFRRVDEVSSGLLKLIGCITDHEEWHIISFMSYTFNYLLLNYKGD